MDFGLTYDEKKNQEEKWKRPYLKKQTSYTYSRYLFNMRNQAEESFEGWGVNKIKLKCDQEKKIVQPFRYKKEDNILPLLK